MASEEIPTTMGDTRPKPFVFVLMPFDTKFDDRYKLGIKPACERAGAYAERVDEQIFHGNILERVYNQISKADILVADMTGRNPNVFYETGYAHALGKPVILLTENADDIPFDLKHYQHIVYEGKIVELTEQLEKRVRWSLENLASRGSEFGCALSFQCEAVRLGDNAVIERKLKPASQAPIAVPIAIHNSTKERRTANFQIGILASPRITHVFCGIENRQLHVDKVSVAQEQILFLPKADFSLLPGAWETLDVRFRTTGEIQPGTNESFVLRAFTPEGPFDFPFTVRFG